MFVKELWRYPVKSMAGEQVQQIEANRNGFEGDRNVVVMGPRGRVITSRTHPKLLGLKGTISEDGVTRVNGFAWDSPEALELVRAVAGPEAHLIFTESPQRFDILPLLVATDGAIAHMNIDRRRLRPNIVVGGVEGLAERSWPGRRLQVGEALVEAAQLRGRCVMTTYDPDTQVQDMSVLKRIVNELDGVMTLDTAVVRGGLIRVGDSVL